MSGTSHLNHKTVFVALRAALFGGLFLAFWLMVAQLVRLLDLLLNFTLPTWTTLTGTTLLLLGAAASLSCVVLFVARGQGTAAPFDPPRQFVVTGLYRYCRNPMYIGLFLMLAGLGMVWHSPAVIALAVLLVAGIHFLVVAWEEPRLEKRFGQPYLDYCRSVPRWIPKL